MDKERAKGPEPAFPQQSSPNSDRLLGTVILKADGEGGWWAVAADSQRCGGEIASTPMAAPDEATVVTFTACGAAHGPHEPGCVCIATLVVDDEVHLLRSA